MSGGNNHNVLKVDITGAADYTQVSVTEKAWEWAKIREPESFRRDINPWLFTEDTTFSLLTADVVYSDWFIVGRVVTQYSWDIIGFWILIGLCSLTWFGCNAVSASPRGNIKDILPCGYQPIKRTDLK